MRCLQRRFDPLAHQGLHNDGCERFHCFHILGAIPAFAVAERYQADRLPSMDQRDAEKRRKPGMAFGCADAVVMRVRVVREERPFIDDHAADKPMHLESSKLVCDGRSCPSSCRGPIQGR